MQTKKAQTRKGELEGRLQPSLNRSVGAKGAPCAAHWPVPDHFLEGGLIADVEPRDTHSGVQNLLWY